MIRNYLKTALRSIFRNKLTAFINIAGLALAMSSALLIYLFIIDELSYDRQHAKADSIYRLTRNFITRDGEVSLHLAQCGPPFGPLLKNDFGEVELMARTIQFGLVMAIEENGERKKITSENDVYVVEPDLFKIFDIPVVNGNPDQSLERPYTVMLSEKAAQKYFSTTDVIGKHLKADGTLDLEVTGVFKNFPLQAHWHPEFMVSFSTLYDSTIYGRRALETNYGNNSFNTYVVLAEGTNPKNLETRFPQFVDKHYTTAMISQFGAAPTFVGSRTTTLFLQKVTDIHLRSHLDSELEVGGNINNVYMMGVIGAFIVLIACFNFVNLSTARATKRAKEVGLRKVAGAFQTQLITQYLSESILVALFGLVLALGFSFVALGWLNDFTRKELVLDLFNNIPVVGGLVAFAFVVGILAGIYPAFVISSFKPSSVLKGQQGSAKGKASIRKTLVVTQFAISVALIIATAITTEQLGYMNSRELGFDKERVVTLNQYPEIARSYEAFYNELIKSTSIKNVGQSSRVPTGRLLDSQGTARVLKDDSLVDTGVIPKFLAIDYEFFDTYGIPMAAGRNFSKAIPTDDTLAFIINETTARKIGWKTNEEAINTDFQNGGVRGKLIGIVKDFHFESLHQEIAPMIFVIGNRGYNNMSVKISGDKLQDGLQYMEKVWKEFAPNRPFDYQVTSDRYRLLYEAEQKQGQLFSVFSGLAIFIACLGLFGLATFNTLQRVKEIGIRKVLGASVPNILALLSKEIIVLIVMANIIAWPVAWYFMNMWLDSFAYHVNMNVLIYLGAAVAAILLALITVSAQTIKAALTSPSTTLRYE